MEDPFDVQQRVFEKKKKWVKLFSTDIWVLDVLMTKGVLYQIFCFSTCNLTVKRVVKSRLICKIDVKVWIL